MKRIYDHYEVIEEFDDKGLWKGYRCSVVASDKRQGKLYPKSDGRQYYQQKKDEDEGLEI